MLAVETKDVINDIIKEFVKAIDLSVASGVVQRVLKNEYFKGVEQLGLQFGMNFTGDPKRLEFLQSYTFENIKGMNDDMADKLRKEISQSMLNLEGIEKMKERVKEVMDTTTTRARMIARTEANRAANMGQLDAARESDLKLVKEWDAHLDSRTSPVCQSLNGKRVGINDKFKYQGEEYDMPPAHVNCLLHGTKISVPGGVKKIENVNIGDEVLTHKNRYKKVIAKMSNTAEEYYEVSVGTQSRRRILRVTGEHPILTQRGWVPTKELRSNDYVVVLK